MKLDLLHNKIISDTITPAFRESFNANLVPKLAEKYGNSIFEVQMYEDYLNDGFLADGEFYYPLTLAFEDEVKTEWIKWSVPNKKLFENNVPYAYIGNGQIEFSIADDVPAEYAEKLSGRNIYFDAKTSAPFSIKTSSPDKTFLSGKYSQTFVDMMACEVTRCIEKAFSVSGSEEGGYELVLVFAPETYMEHVVENVTYRRLLITARGCSARDLWIKWTNLKGDAPLSVSSEVSSEDVKFEIAEDVSHKVREKEYRFLVRASSDKYQYAMGRKNITEWRDLVKRVIKRGDLVKCEVQDVIAPVEESVSAPLMVEAAENIVENVSLPLFDDKNFNDDITAKLQEVLMTDTVEAPAASSLEADNSDLAALLREAIGDEPKADEPVLNIEEPDAVSEEIEKLEEKIRTEEEAKLLEDELRRKIEAEMRAKLELEAKQQLKEENIALIREHERLKAENERLANLAREIEEERIRKEAEREAEAERLRREIEARERAEQREKERLAEAARLAIIEEQRLASIRAEQEAAKRLEEERLAEEARKAEALRIENERRAEEERRKKELEELSRKNTPTPAEPTYISKNARLLFRRQIDPNITKRIHEIILTTIKYFHKEDVYIKIKATVPDSTTVNLHFVKIPEAETELLINIIKVLGKSDLGITKVFLE